MYENIGSKIKTLAKVIFIILSIVSVVGGLTLLDTKIGVFGILIAALGVLFSLVGTFFLYGFGQLIENTDILVAEAKKKVPQPNISQHTITTTVTNPAQKVKRCPLCGEIVTSNTCDFCGSKNDLF